MMYILEKIAKKERSLGIVTGDSLGQVASQTIENIHCIQDNLKTPILSPLIGMNKEEIIQLAKKVGTYETSIIPSEDCCSFMISKHPETKANLDEILKLEENITEKNNLINEAVEKAKHLNMVVNTS